MHWVKTLKVTCLIKKKKLSVPPGPASVTKVFYENGTYELSWKPPITEEEKIESYTIFWCDSIYDHMCSVSSFLSVLCMLSIPHNATCDGKNI